MRLIPDTQRGYAPPVRGGHWVFVRLAAAARPMSQRQHQRRKRHQRLKPGPQPASRLLEKPEDLLPRRQAAKHERYPDVPTQRLRAAVGRRDRSAHEIKRGRADDRNHELHDVGCRRRHPVCAWIEMHLNRGIALRLRFVEVGERRRRRRGVDLHNRRLDKRKIGPPLAHGLAGRKRLDGLEWEDHRASSQDMYDVLDREVGLESVRRDNPRTGRLGCLDCAPVCFSGHTARNWFLTLRSSGRIAFASSLFAAIISMRARASSAKGRFPTKCSSPEPMPSS